MVSVNVPGLKNIRIKHLQSQKIGDRKIEGKCFASLGSIFESLGECVKAKEHSEKALAIAEKIGDRKTEGKCYASLGSMFHCSCPSIPL